MRKLVVVLTAAILGMGAGFAPATAAGGSIHCVGPVTLAVTCATGHSTIQGAVDAASPGDAVVIGAGTYQEAVDVTTPNLIIRGENRNSVRVEGNATNQPFGIRISAPGVEVSNLTVHHFTNSGIYWVGTSDYLARYVTAYNNRGYGVYAFGTHTGVFEDSYASGNADSGFYIGECNPCHAEIRRVVSENNALGYSGTNASNNLVIRDSLWIDNGAGILPNTLDSELLPPQCCIVIENNTVIGSGNLGSPVEGLASAATGIGIGISGGSFNMVRNNVIENCTGPAESCASRYGIAVFPYPATEQAPTVNVYIPNGNTVRDNTISNAGLFDITLAAVSGEMNCFAGNVRGGGGAITSDPAAIETLYPCAIGGSALRNSPVSGSPVAAAELVSGLARFGDRPDWRTAPAPGPQPTMPDPTVGLPV